MASVTTDRRQGLNASMAVKVPCRAATTANITLSGEQTIDGVAVVADDRVLVKDQTTASENGIYKASATTWARDKDFNGANDIVKGTLIYVHSGTANSDTYWRVDTSDPITIGTTSLSFVQAVNNLSGVGTFGSTLISAETASTARTLLGLGTMSTQSSTGISVTGGTMSGVLISSLSTALDVGSGGTGSTGLTADRVISGDSTALRATGLVVSTDDVFRGYYASVTNTTSSSVTLASSDGATLIGITSTNVNVITLPGTTSLSLAAGFQCAIVRRSTGTLSFAVEGSDSIECKTTGRFLSSQHSIGTVVKIVSSTPNTWGLYGDIST